MISVHCEQGADGSSCFPMPTNLREGKSQTYSNTNTMKAINLLAAFLGGAAVGAACGVLFAPEKGSETRTKIACALRKRGIKLDREELESLVDDIDELK